MDKRIIKTNQAIISALFALMAEKELDRITITELSRRANIDRKTFYLHYNSVEQLLASYAESRAEEFRQSMQRDVFDENSRSTFAAFNVIGDMVENDHQFFCSTTITSDQDLFWQNIDPVLTSVSESLFANFISLEPERLGIHARFFSAGIIAVYREWLKNPDSMHIADVNRLTSEIADHGLQAIYANRDAGKKD